MKIGACDSEKIGRCLIDKDYANRVLPSYAECRYGVVHNSQMSGRAPLSADWVSCHNVIPYS